MVAGNGGLGRVGGGLVELLAQQVWTSANSPFSNPNELPTSKALVFMLREFWPCQVGLHW